jgi:predicted amidophosphoribosyltransferase
VLCEQRGKKKTTGVLRGLANPTAIARELEVRNRLHKRKEEKKRRERRDNTKKG